MEKNKIIMIDYGVVVHRAIYASRFNPNVPVEYTALSMVLSWIRKIGYDVGDRVMIACDYKSSWRKAYDKNYKSQRKAQREKQSDINWTVMFAKMDKLLLQLETASDWFILKKESLEADDWFAVASRYYKNNLVVIVSTDSDLHQLLVYPNVRIFSPLRKYKSAKGDYVRDIINPYKLLAKKIDKEVSDGLNNTILNEAEYETRKLIVNLLELPDFIETPLRDILSVLPDFKEHYSDDFPFRNSLKIKYENLATDKSKVIPYVLPEKKGKKKCTKSGTK